MNEGKIHEAKKGEDCVTLEPWFIPPGAPYRMWITKDNHLVVECEGGTVVFSDIEKFNYYSAKEPDSKE